VHGPGTGVYGRAQINWQLDALRALS